MPQSMTSLVGGLGPQVNVGRGWNVGQSMGSTYRQPTAASVGGFMAPTTTLRPLPNNQNVGMPFSTSGQYDMRRYIDTPSVATTPWNNSAPLPFQEFRGSSPASLAAQEQDLLGLAAERIFGGQGFRGSGYGSAAYTPEGTDAGVEGSQSGYIGGDVSGPPNDLSNTQARAQSPGLLAGLANLFNRSNPQGPYTNNGLNPNQNYALGYTPAEIQAISQAHTNSVISGGFGGMAGVGNVAPSAGASAQFAANQRGVQLNRDQYGGGGIAYGQPDELTMGPNRLVGGPPLAGMSPQQFQAQIARGTTGGRR